MKIAIGQIDTILGDIRRNIKKIEHYIDKAIEEKCDLVVFPELATSGYSLRDLVYTISLPPNSNLFSNLIEKSLYLDIVLGFPEVENGYFFNSSMYISKKEIIAIHKKKFLPDYGMFEEGRYFAPGNFIETFQTRFGKTTMLICEDAFHISTHYEAFKNHTDLLIILSASPFWSDSTGMKWEMWENNCKMSAQFNGYFIVFANRVGFEDGIGFFGKSFVVDPFGNTINEAHLLKEELLITYIDLQDIKRAKLKMPIMKNEAGNETHRQT